MGILDDLMRRAQMMGPGTVPGGPGIGGMMPVSLPVAPPPQQTAPSGPDLATLALAAMARQRMQQQLAQQQQQNAAQQAMALALATPPPSFSLPPLGNPFFGAPIPAPSGPGYAREGIGTGYGSYGLPNSADYRSGSAPLPPDVGRAAAAAYIAALGLPASPQPGPGGVPLPQSSPPPTPDQGTSVGQPSAPALPPVPVQSSHQRFLEANLGLGPGEGTYAGDESLRQYLATGRVGAPVLVQQAAQKDIAALDRGKTPPPTITGLDQITDEMVPYLTPGLQLLVGQYREQRAKNPTVDVSDLNSPDNYYVQMANNDLARRWRMSQADLAKDNADYERNNPTSLPAIALAGPETVLQALDAPRRWSVGRAGEDAYLLATGQQQSTTGKFLTWFPGQTDFQAWERDPKNMPFVKNAYENGYTADNGAHFTGGNAVWELFINGQDRWHRGVYDLAYDPLTYAGAATEAGKGAEEIGAGTRALGESGRVGPVAGSLLKAAGRAFEAGGQAVGLPDVLLNKTADEGLNALFRTGRAAVEHVPGLEWLGRTAPETVGEDAARRRQQAALINAGAEAAPTDVVPTPTNIGGVPQPTPTGPLALGPGAQEMPATPPPTGHTTTVTRSTILGDLLEPKPAEATPALPPGELPPPGTPNPNVLPPGSEAIPQPAPTIEGVQPLFGGEPGPHQPYAPGTGTVSDAPLPEVPVTEHRRGYSYVGEAKDYQIAERGVGENKVFEVKPRATSGSKPYSPTPVSSFPVADATPQARQAALDAAVEDAVARVRGEAPAVPEPATAAPAPPITPEGGRKGGEIPPAPNPPIPGRAAEVVPPPAGTEGYRVKIVTRDVAGTVVTDENIATGIADEAAAQTEARRVAAEEGLPVREPAGPVSPRPTRSYLSPKAGGTRAQDVAQGLAESRPTEWQQFKAEYGPKVQQKLAGDAQLDTQYGQRYVPEKAAINAVRDVEHVVDEAVPTFRRAFGDAPELAPSFQYEPRGRSSLPKGHPAKDFRKAPNEYLIERAVYSDLPERADAALNILAHRAANNDTFLAPLLDRIASARARFVELVKQGWIKVSDPTLYAVHPSLRRTMRLGPTEAQSGESIAIGDLLKDAGKSFLTGERPTEAAPPLVQPQPGSAVDAATQAVLDEVMTHPDYAGQNVGQAFDAMTQEARADQEEVHRLVKAGVTPEQPARGKPSGGRRTTKKTVMRTLPDGTKARVTVPVEPVSARPGQRLAELQIKWQPFGNIETADPRRLAAHKLGHVSRLEANPNLGKRLPLLADLFVSALYRTPRSLLLADPITSWGYTGRNVVSNEVMTQVGLHGRDISGLRGLNLRAQAAVGRDAENSVVAAALEDTFGGPGRGLVDAIDTRATQLDVIEKGRRTPTRDAFAKLKLPEYVARAFDWKRGIDHAIERGMKLGGAFLPMFQSFLAEKIDPLATRLVGIAGGKGLALDEEELSRALWAAKKESGGLSRHDVYDAVYRTATGAGADDPLARTLADRGARDWQEGAKAAFDQAIADTNRIFPQRRMTNLDKYLSYAILFHMWPTRAAKFFLEESIRDPRLPLWWYRAHQGLNRLAEQKDYPTAAQGWIRLAQSPLGFALFADPAALFMLQQLQPDRPDYGDPRGETGVGHGLKWLRAKTGLSPTPFFDALFNIAGVYGDDFLPDPLPSRTVQLVGKALDVLLTQSGHHEGDPVYQQTMANLRAVVSSHTGLSVPAASVAGKRSDPIASMVLQLNPDLATRLRDPQTQADAEAELAAVMENPDSDQYKQAERRVAAGGFFTALVNGVSPLGVRTKIPVREDIKDTAHAVPAGLAYDQMTAQQQADKAAWSTVTTTPAAMGAKAEQDQYGNVGTDRGRKIANNWNLIAYGSLKDLRTANPSGFLLDADGKRLTDVDLAKMTPDERAAVADAYLARNGYDVEYGTVRDAQKAFKASHPLYAGYSDFQKMAHDYNKDTLTDDHARVSAFRDALMGTSAPYRTYIGRLNPSVKSDPEQFDKASINMDAYLAAKGTKSNVYAADLGGGPNAFPGMEMLKNILGTGYGSAGPKYDVKTPAGMTAALNDKLASYERDMAAYNKQVAKIAGGNGYDNLPEFFQKTVRTQLEARGITKPATPDIVNSYALWKSMQDPGADTSVGAYVKWYFDYQASGKTAA